ncbi:MAG: hypothetical protein RI956_824 [Pseudomonadota bacterium]|jgi:Ni/Co efflux regulator RcnB
MKKIITAILATAFVAGVAISPAHATDNQTSAKEVKVKKFRLIMRKIDGPCKHCRKPNPNAKDDALTPEQFEELFGN